MADPTILDEDQAAETPFCKCSAMERMPLRCRVSLQSKYLIALCVAALTFILAVHSLTSFANVKEISSMSLAERHAVRQAIRMLQSIRRCVLRESKRFEGSAWRVLHVIINSCAVNSAFFQRRYSYINFRSDKSFLAFRSHPAAGCNAVTLGVGNEVNYERVLQRKYPQCHFYGADPYPDTGDVFRTIGQVFYTAIDNVTSRDHYLRVLRNGKYDWRSGVTVTSLGDFLKSVVRVRMVHFLSMDIEGAEYRVIPYMTKSGAFDTESENAVVCQISAEFHGPLSHYNVSAAEFESIWQSLLSDSPYVPLRAFPPGYHHRFHLFNMESDECVRLFLI